MMIEIKGDVEMSNEWKEYSMTNGNEVKRDEGKVFIRNEDGEMLVTLTDEEWNILANYITDSEYLKVPELCLGERFDDDEESEISKSVPYLELEGSNKRYLLIDSSKTGEFGRELELWHLDDGEEIDNSFILNVEDFKEIGIEV